MKKLFTFWTLVVTLLMSSCSSEYDDSALSGRVDGLENRVAKLEELCKQMNTNISSLRTLVNALQNQDYIQSVTPITKEGKTIGYTITFSKSAPITIYHGENGKDGHHGTDGKDGHTPVIGVRQDADGLYYWTLDGEWLTNTAGEKIKAEGTDGKDGTDGTDGTPGTDGKDGITPQLKIEANYWYMSYDKGTTWTKLGKATGEDGKDGTNGTNGSDGQDGTNAGNIFKSVTQDDDNVYFTLAADDSVITIPKRSTSTEKKLSIEFIDIDKYAVIPGNVFKINYSITATNINPEEIEVFCTESNDWKCESISINSLNGILTVTVPNPVTESGIRIFVSDNSGISIIRTLRLSTDGTITAEVTYRMLADDTSLEIPVTSNVKYTYSTSYPYWIKFPEIIRPQSTRTIPSTTEKFVFELLENNTGIERSYVFELYDAKWNVIKRINIIQSGITSKEFIKFKDREAEKYCINFYDENKDGYFSYEEAAKVTKLYATMYYPITSFNEFQYFTSITTLSSETFLGLNIFTGNVKELTLPNTLTTIGESAFKNCKNIKKLIIPESVQTIESSAFRYANIDSLFILSKNLTGPHVFYGCSGKYIHINCDLCPDGKEIFNGLQYDKVVLGDNITSVGEEQVGTPTTLVLGKNTNKIEGVISPDGKITNIYIPYERFIENIDAKNIYDGINIYVSSRTLADEYYRWSNYTLNIKANVIFFDFENNKDYDK